MTSTCVEQALSPKEVEVLSVLSQSIVTAISEYNGALKMIVSIHDLPGEWRFDPTRLRLVRKSEERKTEGA